MHVLPTHRLTSAFTAAGLRRDALPMGHFLNVDHFHMSQPTFPPHPHAGFSAVTWMMPWSPGGFVNRDSHGDRTRIGPGSLHWTLAGSGILHEEIPEQPGQDCEGLQIFVKLPEALETTAPRAFHLDPHEIPTARHDGGTLRVLAGEHGGVTSPVPSHARTTLLHADVDGEVVVHIPEGVEAFAMVLRGRGHAEGVAVERHVALPLSSPRARFAGDGLSVLVAWSEPMSTPPTFSGPFCMFDNGRLAAARAAFGSGAMGRLDPSPVRWVR